MTTVDAPPMLTAPEVDVDLIDPAPDNPRKNIGDVSELAASIREMGVLQPLVVSPKVDGRFALIAGHRRLAASKLAGLGKVPVTFSRIDSANTLRRAVAMIVENVHRVDLTGFELAETYKRLMADHDLNQSQLARMIGKSPTHVNQTLRLLIPIDERVRQTDTYRRRRDAGVPQVGRPLAEATVEDTMGTLRAGVHSGCELSAAQVKVALRVIEQGVWALQRERARDRRLSGASASAA